MTEETTYPNPTGNNMDSTVCPLCGEPNDCVMAGCDKVSDTPCWCNSGHFSRELLNQVPEHFRNCACICPACLQQYSQNNLTITG